MLSELEKKYKDSPDVLKLIAVVRAVGPFIPSCQSAHHERKDLHASTSPCPVVDRYTLAVENLYSTPEVVQNKKPKHPVKTPEQIESTRLAAWGKSK